MAKAVKTKLQSIADMNLKNYFHGNVPTHYSDVLVAISERSTIK
ncbi:hypothetical protein [Heyndrickxia ginsengihumi]|nr:hypothetical protein [Heyndrickxia ginsengihumi]